MKIFNMQSKTAQIKNQTTMKRKLERPAGRDSSLAAVPETKSKCKKKF